MRFALLSLFCFATICNSLQGIDQTQFDEKLYKQATAYDSLLADSFYCWKIPEEAFTEFAELYKSRPIAVNTFGMGSHGNFFLWYLIKQINPVFVIESGVFKGLSTWTIEKAAPKAKILAIDPDTDWRTYKSRKAAYTTLDFSHLQIDASMFKGPVVCFFDDQENAYERVLQAHKKGFKYLIFNNNCPACTEDEIYYLTLRHCFERKEFKDKKKTLKKLIKHYFIMPQIIGKESNYPICEKMTTNLPAIWESPTSLNPTIKNQMTPYIEDSTNYRWITYVELY